MVTVVRSRVYLVLAGALVLFMFAGFTRTYYLRTLFEVPPISYLMHVHALLFTAWMVLFFTQARLISKQNYQAHMRLGIAGVVLAAMLCVVGTLAVIAAMAVPGPRPLGFTPVQAGILPASSIALFAVLVTAALLLRKRASLHKRLMILAMIAILGPPTARLVRATGLGADFLEVQMVVTALFIIGALIADWVRHRAVHPAFAVGGVLLLLSWPARVAFGRTPAWEAIGQWLLEMGTFLVF